MKNLNELGWQKLSQEELLSIEGGSIFTKARDWCVQAAENTWAWVEDHWNGSNGFYI